MNSSHVIFNSNTHGSDQLPRSAIMGEERGRKERSNIENPKSMIV
jgi:hypothetical protein